MSQAVHDMFAKIARRYDIANDLLSFGIHRLWRRRLVHRLGLNPGMQVLDLCTGTGDLALLLSQTVGPSGSVAGLDFVSPMLQLARKKGSDTPVELQSARLFLQGDAMRIPFPDNTFDAVTIAFGIRNVDDPAGCLDEIRRVLRPGGTVGVLEFGQPTIPGFAALYRFYSKHLMPLIGGAVTGSRSAYIYLPETSRAFPSGSRFEKIIAEREFGQTKTRALFGGIAFIYTGISNKIPSNSAVPGRIQRNSVEGGSQALNL